MACKYCNETDPLKLSLSTRIVNGRVETIEVCSNCYWRERFESEGKNGILPERKANRKALSRQRESSVNGNEF